MVIMQLIVAYGHVRTLAPGNAFARRSRAVDALDTERARLGLPERRLEGRI